MALRLSGFVLILSILGLSGYAALDQSRRATLGPAESISEAERKPELASYCLELEETATFFRRGPGGSTAIGPC